MIHENLPFSETSKYNHELFNHPWIKHVEGLLLNNPLRVLQHDAQETNFNEKEKIYKSLVVRLEA